MRFPFFVARRYLFSKKSHNAINIISTISALGIAVATMALVCVLSVFNGFRELIGGLYSTFDPQIEITPAKGKLMPANHPKLQKIKDIEAVADASATYQEQALILFVGNPVVVTVKGVDDHFASVTGLDSIVYGPSGQHERMTALSAAGVHYAIPGFGLATKMGLDFDQIQICAPRRGERINLAAPQESFNVDFVFSSKKYFQVNQRSYDEDYLLTSLAFAQNLFEHPGEISALELKLKPGADEVAVMKEIEALSDGEFVVKDRMMQHEDMFRVMKIEKLMAWIFLTFIVVVACFNLIGSVSMLIIDKQANMDTLHALGLTLKDTTRIFLIESRLITLIGATLGIGLGLLACWLQKQYGFISLGGAGNNFIVNAYPVSVHATDIVVTFVSVIVAGSLTVWYPVRLLCRRMF